MNKAIVVCLMVLLLAIAGAVGGYVYLTKIQKSQSTSETPSFQNPFTPTPTPTSANPFASPSYQNPFGETENQQYKNPFESLR